VNVIDFKRRSIHFATDWGFGPYWKKLHDEKYGALMPSRGGSPAQRRAAHK
jgi:hypothetical protein